MAQLLSAVTILVAPFIILSAIAAPASAQFVPPDNGGPDRTGSTGTR